MESLSSCVLLFDAKEAFNDASLSWRFLEFSIKPEYV